MNSIKLLLSLFTLTICNTVFCQQDKVLMTVDGDPVSLEEFTYIYEKNNGNSANYSKESLEEYLELYKKFKLKVQKARDLKIDTIQSLQEELGGYKRQLANSYLKDKDVAENLLAQVYNRKKQDVRFSHIMIPLSSNSTQRNINLAKSQLEEALTKLKEGQSWEAVVAQYSQDKNTSTAGGDMGFFTAMLPNGFYELENALYEGNTGAVAGPVKSKVGYHLIKVTDKRAARGEMEVAQILVRKKDNPAAEDKIKTVYTKLKEGMDFKEAVKLYTEDKQFAVAGGLLPVFGIGKYEKSFENAAYALSEDGDISEPIETSIGWHVLKRVRKHGEMDYGRFKDVFGPKIKLDERYEYGKAHLLEDIRKAAFYKMDNALLDKFKASLDDEFFTYRWTPLEHEMMDATLFTLGDNKYTLGELAKFSKKNTRIRLRFDKNTHEVAEPVDALFDAFLEEKTLDHEQSNLESRYPDFKSLMREYEEGILLFEATKQAVWDRANQDSVGLQSFYNENKNNYLTKGGVTVEKYVVRGTTAKKIKKIKKYAGSKPAEKTIKKYNKKGIEVITSTSTVTLVQAEELGFSPAEGFITELEEENGEFVFHKVVDVQGATPKALADARGYVVADYQDFLEKVWVNELEDQFPVEINQEVFNSLIR